MSASLCRSYVTVVPAAMMTRSLTDGIWPIDHTPGSDHEPLRVDVTVGVVQRFGMPLASCASARPAANGVRTRLMTKTMRILEGRSKRKGAEHHRMLNTPRGNQGASGAR